MAQTQEAGVEKWPLIPSVLKFLASALLIASLSSHWSGRLGDALMPYFQAEIFWLDDTYRIDKLYVDHEGADEVIRIRVGQTRNIVIRDMVFAPHPLGKANASTLLGNITLTAVLLISCVLAWPAHRWWLYGLRAVVVPVVLALLWAVDVPMILWGAIWSLHVDAFAPDLFSPLLVWCQFLQGGGRLVLAVLAGISVGVATNGLYRWSASVRTA